MLSKIISFSIANKLIIGIGTLGLIVWGIVSLMDLPIDAVPDITNNQVQVVTTAPSSGAVDIERYVTYPIEQTMATIPDVEEIRSFSRFGLSVVTIVFDENTDIYWAREQVSQRLQEAKNAIPKGLGEPGMAPVSTGLGEIYQYIVKPKSGFEKKYDAMELRTIQDWLIRRQLLGTKGVADVSGFGGKLKQYEIAVDPETLRRFNISIAELFQAIEANNANTGGAYITRSDATYYIRSEGLTTSLDDIRNTLVKQIGEKPVLVSDLAEVRYGSAIRYGALTNSFKGEAVGGIVLMLKDANASQVIQDVKQRMEQIRKTLPEGVEVEVYLDRTKLVNKAIHTVQNNLIEGALIVIFILVLLLGNIRAGLIVASVIPLAMLFAIAMMGVFGVSGNLMSLGAIDFGLIVDGAVIIVEATLHHLVHRKTAHKLSQQELNAEVESSAKKIMKSAAFGEIIILIVYLPLLTLVGIEGKMFRPMAQTVIFAIIGAFILSLTYVPMISSLVLSRKKLPSKTLSDRLVGAIQRRYEPALNGIIRRSRIAILVVAAIFVVAISLFMSLGAEFIPSLDEGDYAVEMRAATGSSLDFTIEKAMQSSKILQKAFPDEVKTCVGKIGTAEIPTDPMPMEACDLMVILKDREQWKKASNKEELAEKMQRTLEDAIPGVSFGFQQPIQMRFNEMMSGAKQDVVVKIYGEDLDKLASYSKEVGKLIATVQGATDIYVEEVTGLPQLMVKMNRQRLAQYHLNISDVNNAINMGFAGQVVGQVFEGEKRFDLVVRLKQAGRQNMDDLKNLTVVNPDGLLIPIEQVATVVMENGPNQIQRDDAKRRIIVAFNVRGRDVESIVKELQEKIDQKVDFESGYYPTFGGSYKNLEKAKARLSIAVPVALFMILFLLYLTFQSIKQALLIFSAIPLAAIGGIIALWMRGMPFSISAGVGFIALFGVAVLNGIVLVAEFNFLRKVKNYTGIKVILGGTRVRLRPVLMTAMVASLGFLPMALSTGSGAEVQKPLATVVIGGLISATFLTLFLLPVLYYLVELRPRKKKDMGTKTIMTLLVIGFGVFGANAQTTTRSLDECLQMARQRNLTIQAAELSVEQARLDGKAQVVVPKTDANLMVGQYNSDNKSDNNITLSQSIPFPTVFVEGAKVGKTHAEAKAQEVSVAAYQLEQQVRTNYEYLKYYFHQQLLYQQLDSVYERLATTSATRVAEGDVATMDLELVQVNRFKQQQAIKQCGYEITRLQNELKQLLQTQEEIVPRLDETYSVLLGAEKWDTSRVSNVPEVMLTESQLKAIDQDRRLAKTGYLPDLNFGYFNQTLIGNQPVGGQNTYFTSRDRFQGFTVGVSVPLFFGSTKAQVKQQQILREQKVLEQQNVKSNFVYQYETTWENYQSLLEHLSWYDQEIMPKIRSLSEKNQQAFRSGNSDLHETLLTQQTIIQQQIDYQNYVLQANLLAHTLIQISSF